MASDVSMKDHTGQDAMLVDRGACPLCGGTARTLVHDFDQIPVVRCGGGGSGGVRVGGGEGGGCGFVFSSRVFTPEATARYYAQDWGSVWHRAGQEINARVNAGLLPRLVTLARGSRVLDVGCGYGFLGERLRARGVESIGVEVSRGESAFAREQLKLDVRTGMLSEVGLAPASFDLVCSFEVIEHLLDPGAFLREMVAMCKVGGTVLVCTDNFDAPIVRRMGAEFPKWIPHTHVSHFDAPSLRRLMESCGLRVERECSYTNWETAARDLKRRVSGRKPRTAREAWSLDMELRQEMGRAPKLLGLRKAFNPLWAKMASSRRAEDGGLMFVAGRRGAGSGA